MTASNFGARDGGAIKTKVAEQELRICERIANRRRRVATQEAAEKSEGKLVDNWAIRATIIKF